MPVQIIINGENAEKTIQELFSLASAFTSGSVSESEAPSKEEKPKRTRQTKAKEEKSINKVLDTDEMKLVDVDQVREDDVEEISDVELRKQATAVSKAGKREEVKALVEEFGAKNLTSIPQNKRAEFLKRLEEL